MKKLSSSMTFIWLSRPVRNGRGTAVFWLPVQRVAARAREGHVEDGGRGSGLGCSLVDPWVES